MRLHGLLLASSLAFACSNGEKFVPWELEDLTSERGFSIRIPEFTVDPGRESQRCYFLQVPDLDSGQDLWIDRVRSAINPGSHHMNVFRVRTLINLRPEDGEPVQLGDVDGTMVDGGDEYSFAKDGKGAHPCWDSGNWFDWPLIFNSQNSKPDDPFTEWQLPENVAVRLPPGEWLMIQTHYVNTSLQPTDFGARVGVNFHRTAHTPQTMELGSLFATQQNIRICRSKPSVTFAGTCSFPDEGVTITAANGHFHKRGSRFAMYSWDGASETHPEPTSLFYESLRWDDPPMATNLEIPGAAGIWWDCEYQWHEPESGCAEVDAKDPFQENDCCYTFGGNTDVGEHCNVFLYYYPKLESDVFCN